MLKSLWSGLTGIQSHQQAIDVESNNIANSNTNGFKYSTTSFEDLISQTYNTSFSPTETIGGINGTQIGLGVQVSSIEKVFSQGSLEATDRTTDLAIAGNGFFVLSDYDGSSTSYSRDGQFKFDVDGNLVNNNGINVMGWNADTTDFSINNNSRLENLHIDQKMKIPPKQTNELFIKANLNNSNKIEEMNYITEPLSIYEDFNSLLNEDNKNIYLNDENYIEYSFEQDGEVVSNKIFYNNDFKSLNDLINNINDNLNTNNGEKLNNDIYIDGNGRITDLNQKLISINSNNDILNKIFEPLNNGNIKSNIMKTDNNSNLYSNDIQELFDNEGNKIDLKNGQGISIDIEGLKEKRNFVYVEADSSNLNDRILVDGGYQSMNDLTVATTEEGFHWTKNSDGLNANLNYGDEIKIEFQNLNNENTPEEVILKYGINFSTLEELTLAVNDVLNLEDDYQLDTSNEGFISKSDDFIKNITVNSVKDENGNPLRNGIEDGLSRFEDMFSKIVNNDTTDKFYQNNTYYFNNTQNLENLVRDAINDSGNPLVSNTNNSADVFFNDYGQLEIKNSGSQSMAINIEGYPDIYNDNDNFTNLMNNFNTIILPNEQISSNSFMNASHTITTSVFDNNGIARNLDFNFVKKETLNNNNEIIWEWKANIDETSSIIGPSNGEIKFSADGNLLSYTPSTLTFISNNATDIPITIDLNFGNLGDINGFTSKQKISNTEEIIQDGYSEGQLEDLNFNNYGIIEGTFSNGLTKNLGQVAMAIFANDGGLENLGDNLYKSSSNSGIPDITTAGKPGVGIIENNSLEKSNVDLSKSLVNLIVYQRGFSANSKIITTADEMLKELISLKR